MTANELWYDEVGPAERLAQGDIILECPLLAWSSDRLERFAEDENTLKAALDGFTADLVVMTQACDLEYDKIANPVLCPHVSLDQFKSEWLAHASETGQSPTPKAWKGLCKDLKDGFVWDHVILNGYKSAALSLELRVVSFEDVFSVPRAFLEKLLASRGEQRLRLRPPYREHLSQAFARFFMRVGLPTPVDETW